MGIANEVKNYGEIDMSIILFILDKSPILEN